MSEHEANLYVCDTCGKYTGTDTVEQHESCTCVQSSFDADRDVDREGCPWKCADDAPHCLCVRKQQFKPSRPDLAPQTRDELRERMQTQLSEHAADYEALAQQEALPSQSGLTAKIQRATSEHGPIRYWMDQPGVEAYTDVTAEVERLRNLVAMYEGRTQS